MAQHWRREPRKRQKNFYLNRTKNNPDRDGTRHRLLISLDFDQMARLEEISRQTKRSYSMILSDCFDAWFDEVILPAWLDGFEFNPWEMLMTERERYLEARSSTPKAVYDKWTRPRRFAELYGNRKFKEYLLRGTE